MNADEVKPVLLADSVGADYVPERPEFCRCGRQLEIRVERNSYADRSTGEFRTTTYRQCPRFARSWRNLGFGGGGHLSLWGFIGCREWR